MKPGTDSFLRRMIRSESAGIVGPAASFVYLVLRDSVWRSSGGSPRVAEVRAKGAIPSHLSIDKIAARSGLCRNTTKRALSDLERAGWITIDRRPTQAHVYILGSRAGGIEAFLFDPAAGPNSTPGGSENDPRGGQNLTPMGTPGGSENDPRGGQNLTPGGSKLDPRGGQNLTPEDLKDLKFEKGNEMNPDLARSISKPVRRVKRIDRTIEGSKVDNAVRGAEGADHRDPPPYPPPASNGRANGRPSAASMERAPRSARSAVEMALDEKTGRAVPRWELDHLLSSRAKDARTGTTGEGWTADEFLARWRSVFATTFGVEDLGLRSKADRVKAAALVGRKLEAWFDGDRSRLWRYLLETMRWWKECQDAEKTFPSGLPSLVVLLDKGRRGPTSAYFEQWRSGSFKRDVAEIRRRA